MFERFSDGARRVVTLAQEQARQLGHDYIGTEHLLLGLLAQDHRAEQDVALAALASFDVDLTAARAEVCRIVGEGERAQVGHIPFTPRAKKVLELTLQEALSLGYNHIDTGHLLLGLLREGEGVAGQVLTDLGVELPRLRAWMLDRVPPTGTGPLTESAPEPHEWTPPRLRPARDRLLAWTEPGWRLVYHKRPLIEAGMLVAVPVLLYLGNRCLARTEARLAALTERLEAVSEQFIQ
jgi:ATP-dependent Clp protease ATP-binding subunit ClpC